MSRDSQVNRIIALMNNMRTVPIVAVRPSAFRGMLVNCSYQELMVIQEYLELNYRQDIQYIFIDFMQNKFPDWKCPRKFKEKKSLSLMFALGYASAELEYMHACGLACVLNKN